MRFEWLRFVKSHRIAYSDRGENVARGNIVIHCPFCGSADQGRHLGLSLISGAWGCWRNSSHRGGKPHRLIQALLGCSFAEASRLAGDNAGVDLPDDFGTSVRQMLSKPKVEALAPRTIAFTEDIIPLEDRGIGRLFVDYLEHSRGYGRLAALQLAEHYGLRCTIRGRFRYRIVIPIEMDGVLVTWTGRSVLQSETLRYDTLSTDAEKAKESGTPQALRAISDCLLNYDKLTGGDVLLIGEGPLDGLRMDFFGRGIGVHGTCLFGKRMSDVQYELLMKISPRYKHRALILDRDALLDTVRMGPRMQSLGLRKALVPNGFDDPAEFTKPALKQVADAVRNR